jgi:hypothetical protein
MRPVDSTHRAATLCACVLLSLVLAGVVTVSSLIPAEAQSLTPPLSEFTAALPADPAGSSTEGMAQATAAATRTWAIQTLVAPHLYAPGPDAWRLRLDSDDNPHIAYGGDGLYYASYDGAWHIEAVNQDQASSVSLALDSLGRPHIAYVVEWDLKYVWWTGATWQTQAIGRATASNSPYAFLALDAADRPHIAYTNSGAVVYAHLSGGQWVTETVDTVEGAGISLALDSGGQPHVTYVTWDWKYWVKYARRTSGGWQTEVVDDTTSVAPGTSLALDSAGRPRVAYKRTSSVLCFAVRGDSHWELQEVLNTQGFDGFVALVLDSGDNPRIVTATSQGIQYLRWDGSNWSALRVGEGTSTSPSLVLDHSGSPHLVYSVGMGYYSPWRLSYGALSGSNWTIQTVDEYGDAGLFNSLAVDNNGYPHISYFERAYQDLKYARWTGSVWEISTIDSEGETGLWNALAIDPGGHPHVAYFDSTLRKVKYARWSEGIWNIETVDDCDGQGFVSMQVDQNGYPHMLYLKNGLRYAWKTPTGWQTEYVDAMFDEGTGLVLDGDNSPHIAYYGAYPGCEMRYARRTASGWVSETVGRSPYADPCHMLDSPSIALDSGGRPRISYGLPLGATLATWTGATWQVERLLVNDGAPNPTILLDPSDNLHMAYGGVEYAGWSGQRLIGGPLDATGRLDRLSRRNRSLALDSRGNLHLSYYDERHGHLKYAFSGPLLLWDGPTEGQPNHSYTFTATISPGTGTLPVNYTWQTTDHDDIVHTGQTADHDSIAVSWGVVGSKAISVTAYNANRAVKGSMEMLIRWRSYLPLVAKPCLPAYNDDFSNPASGWPIVNNTNYAMGYLNGEYRIKVKRANWMAYLWDDFGASDFRVEVDARPAAHLAGGVGLIFGRTENGYYLFEVSDGSFIVLRHDSWSGTWTTLVDWTSSPAIRKGAETNHLKVIRSGTGISLYVNGQPVGGTTDSTHTGAGLGIAADAFSANFDGRFDNFAVYTGACAGAANTQAPNSAASLEGPTMEHGSESR